MDLVRYNIPNFPQQTLPRENEIFLDFVIIFLASLLVTKIISIGHRSIRRMLLRRRPIQEDRQELPVVLRRAIFRP